jgi:hypothetical protein
MPVVGSTNVPAPVMAGSPFDGVVLLNMTWPGPAIRNAMGSGSLIQNGNGHYILTVAHNNPTAIAAMPGNTPGLVPGQSASGSL